jgi:hypothetical protein
VGCSSTCCSPVCISSFLYAYGQHSIVGGCAGRPFPVQPWCCCGLCLLAVHCALLHCVCRTVVWRVQLCGFLCVGTVVRAGSHVVCLRVRLLQHGSNGWLRPAAANSLFPHMFVASGSAAALVSSFESCSCFGGVPASSWCVLCLTAGASGVQLCKVCGVQAFRLLPPHAYPQLLVRRSSVVSSTVCHVCMPGRLCTHACSSLLLHWLYHQGTCVSRMVGF